MDGKAIRVEIEYCGAWNYLPDATRVAAEIKNAFGVETKLVRGDNGIFDVKLNGKLIYTKAKTHGFPDPGEIATLITKGQ